jgi:hypothetical protein
MYRLLLILILLAPLFSARPATAADINQVMAEYQANPVAFKQKYFGQTISVTGPVGAVYDSYVALGNPRFFVVDCFVASPAQLRSLSPGSQVSVNGTVSSLLTGNGVQLRPCTLQ